MKKLIILLLCAFAIDAIAQDNLTIGKFLQINTENGKFQSKVITNPQVFGGDIKSILENPVIPSNSINSSSIRWSMTDPYGIANDMAMSGNGVVGYCGWALNNKRVSAYNNTDNTPYWEYTTSASGNRSYVASSDTGVVVTGAYHNINLFTKNSGTPFFNFDLTSLVDTGIAGPVAITSNGKFLIGSASRNDTSTIMGFNSSSATIVWKLRIPTSLQGIRISGNDSLAIINTYSAYWVVNTYTGAIRYNGAITGGTQMTQGISGNGSIIGIVNYQGQLKVLQWNGTAYTQLWQYQEPTGSYYNWISCIDISYDGSYVAIGTLIFVTSSSYDGRIRFFKVSTGNTPVWSYTNMMDEVSWITFSKNQKILAATSWGDQNSTKSNLVVFKVSDLTNTPIYSLIMPGSPYVCSLSNDGTLLNAGGKAVHARLMGYGGTYYSIFIDTATSNTGIVSTGGNIPKKYALYQNYPNPFNPETNIKFDMPNSGFASLKIYNILGKEVMTL